MKLPFWTVLLLAVSICTANGKICTKETRLNSPKLKFDKFTKRVYTVDEVVKKIDYVCCAGYMQVGTTGLQPKCDPICEHPCGHGLCYTPNTCACDMGYKHSELGTCVQDGSMQSSPSTTSTSTLLTTSSSQYPKTMTTPRQSSKSSQKSTKPPLHTTSLGYVEGEVPVIPRDFHLNSRIGHTHKSRQDTPLTTTLSEFVEVTPHVSEVHVNQNSHENIITTTQNIPAAITDSIRYIKTVKTLKNTCGTCTFGTCQYGSCICPSGYILSHEGNCEPLCIQSCQFGRCSAPNFCQCQTGYIYDSDRHQCKPLCNGKIYGCIRGHCVGYNQCRCDNGTVLPKDELFHCVDKESLHEQPFNSRLLFLLLLIPTIFVLVSCFLVVKRWHNAKVNRLDNQDSIFSEVRYFNSESDHSNEQIYQKARSIDNEAFGETSCSRGTIQRNGNLVIINT